MRTWLPVLLLPFGFIAHASEYSLPIPSDAKAQYFVLEKGGSSHMPTMVTKRVGLSGTSYSKRIFDCKAQTVKYLGTGDTLEEMARSKPDLNLGSLVTGSIAWYQWQHACEK